MANNIITAAYSSSNITYTKPAYQYDYGMILKFSGIELPQAYEVHFSNTEFCGESISQIGDESGVTIPDEMFLSGNPIYAWTFLHTGEDDGETVYKTVISINKRAQPSDIEPTPVQQDVITQAIAALNTAVEQTAQDVVDATAAKDAAELAQGKAEDAQTAAETAQGKAEDAQSSAEGFAGYASQSASDAQGYASDAQGYAQDAEAAAGSVLGLTADASVDANVGTPSVEVNVSTVSDHKNMSFSFHNLKGVPGDPGEPGDDGFSPVVSVSSITGGHEVAVTDAEGTQTFEVLDGEVSEEQLETALIDKADVITSTASGKIVTISDGGNDMPVVDLKVSLLPVQNLNGQANPYPPGGGINLANPAEFETGKKLNNVGQVVSGSAYSVSGWIPVEANTDYCFRNVINSASGYAMCVYDENKEFLRYLVVSGTTPVNGVKNTGADAVWGRLTFVNASIDNSMLAKSSSIIPFAPYSNVCPISGWTGVNVRATGENLLDMSLLTYFTWDASEGAYKIDPATSFSIRKTAVPFKDNTQYVITATVRATQSGTKWGLFVEYTDSTRSEWARTTTSYQTLTIITDANKTISRIGRQRGADSGSVYIKDWIIAESSVAVPYEPFGQVIPIDWTSTAGTVYRAVVDVTNGTVESWRGFVEFSGDDGWNTGTVSSKTVFQLRRPSQITSGTWFLSNYITRTDSLNGSGKDNMGYFGSTYFNVYCPSVPDLATWKAMLNTTPMQINFTLSSHPVYQIDPNQISTFLGQNNFWTNTDGQIDLEYRADTKLYIEQLTKPTEDDMVANANIASGRFFMVGNRLMLSTTAIAQGEQIVVGTNCNEVSLADALNTINS